MVERERLKMNGMRKTKKDIETQEHSFMHTLGMWLKATKLTRGTLATFLYCLVFIVIGLSAITLWPDTFSDLDVPFETVEAVTTAVSTTVGRKSGNVCQLEHLSNGSAVLTRDRNPSTSNRSIKVTSPRNGALVKRPKIVSVELEQSERKGDHGGEHGGWSEIECETGDDVFEPHDPKRDANIFVYSASNEPVKRKARKNLLTFKSPPPPDVLDASTLTIENEKKSKRLKGIILM